MIYKPVSNSTKSESIAKRSSQLSTSEAVTNSGLKRIQANIDFYDTGAVPTNTEIVFARFMTIQDYLEYLRKKPTGVKL